MKELDPIFVFKNPTFRKIIFFKDSKIIQIMILSIVTTIIFTSFPLITQFFIKYLYFNGTLNEIYLYTFIFTIVYLFKLIIDIKLEKYETVFFLKLEKNVKEKILETYSSDIKNFLGTKKNLFTKHLGLFILLTRTIHRNILDLTKIIIMGTIIFFYDVTLFYYFLVAFPFLILFYFLVKRNFYSKKIKKKERYEPDFGLLLNSLIKYDQKIIVQKGKQNLEFELEKNLMTKTSHIRINQIITSFINFYRLYYLAYFGILVLTQQMSIVNLIVGLLFITMLIKSITSLLKSIPFYSICSNSFFQITSLMKDRSENNE